MWIFTIIILNAKQGLVQPWVKKAWEIKKKVYHWQPLFLAIKRLKTPSGCSNKVWVKTNLKQLNTFSMSQVGTLSLRQTQSWLMVATPHLSTGCLVRITLQSLIASLVLKNKPKKDFLFLFFFFNSKNISPRRSIRIFFWLFKNSFVFFP